MEQFLLTAFAIGCLEREFFPFLRKSKKDEVSPSQATVDSLDTHSLFPISYLAELLVPRRGNCHPL